MGETFRRHPLVTLLAAAAGVLLAIVALEVGFGSGLKSQAAAAAARRSSFEAKLLPSIAIVSPEQAYPEAAARPLFTPTRRQAPPATAAAGAMTKGQFVLQGVTMVGDLKIAMLREKSNNKVHRVEKGKDVNGITVAEIEPEKVVLSQGGEQEVLTMLVQRGVQPTAAAVQAGPFAGSTPPGASAAATPPPAPGAPPPGTQLPPGPLPGASGPGPVPMPGSVPGPVPVPGQNPAQRASPQATAEPGAAPVPGAVMSPEELLARRRARRAQPNQ